VTVTKPTKIANKRQADCTQESVVGVRLEEFFRSVKQESKREEDLDIGSLLK
jgi:hypothetical protein